MTTKKLNSNFFDSDVTKYPPDDSLSSQRLVTEDTPISIPENFVATHDGVFYSDDKFNTQICSYLVVRALVRNNASENWGKLLEFKDPDGKLHHWLMPMEMLKGNGEDLRGELLRLGLMLSSDAKSRTKLIEYITSSIPSERITCVSQTGWHGNVYVSPNKTIGSTHDTFLYQGTHTYNHFEESNTLEDWQKHIAKYCIGNPNLTLAISIAFAATLLNLSKAESGGIHFVGESSCGKTTALRVAASVFGSKNYVRQWRSTSNGLEGLAAQHTDTLLILDELSQIDPREAGEVAYMLANGSGKARATKNGSAQMRNLWRLLFLSAGEISLTQHIQSIGKRAKAGQEVRMIDLPVNSTYGIFDNLHGFNSGAEFAQHLSTSANKYYGTAIIEFLQKLINQPNIEKFPEYIKQRIESFLLENLPIKASGQVVRGCERFALISIAGELATHFGITGWQKGDATQASKQCFQRWIQHRGGLMNQEKTSILSHVRSFLELHGNSRFQLDDNKAQIINHRAGFKSVDEEKTTFYIFRDVFQKEICAEFDVRTVTKLLIEEGWLELDSEGNPTIPMRFSGMARARCYVTTQKIWEDD